MRRITWVAGLAVVLIGLTGCASQDDEPGDTTAEETPSASAGATPSSSAPSPTPTAPAGTTIEITVEGHDISPNGKTVKAGLGEPVNLVITSDASGELHVHSTPDQEVAFKAGTSTHELTFDKPGVVEVEDHHSGKVVVKLQIS